MSIILDDREDTLLHDHLAQFGLPFIRARLDYGDIAIEASNGWLIGYERKRLTDLISSMQDRRLSGRQLRGMYTVYDRVELIVEGIFKPGPGGEILVPNGRSGNWQPLYHRSSAFSYRQIDSYLYSQQECGGVYIWRTRDTAETAQMIASRYHWWQKDYDLHKSHEPLFSNAPSAQRRGAVTIHQGEPNAVTITAAQAPCIDAKAWDVGKQFASIRDMVNSNEQTWRTITWTDRKGNIKHFGPDTSKEIVDWFWGRKPNGQKA